MPTISRILQERVKISINDDNYDDVLAQNKQVLRMVQFATTAYTRLIDEASFNGTTGPYTIPFNLHNVICSCIKLLTELPEEIKSNLTQKKESSSEASGSSSTDRDQQLKDFYASFVEWNSTMLITLMEYHFHEKQYDDNVTNVNSQGFDTDSDDIRRYTPMQDRTIYIIELLSKMAGMTIDTTPQSLDEHVTFVNHGVAIIALSMLIRMMRLEDKRELDLVMRDNPRRFAIIKDVKKALFSILGGTTSKKLHREALIVASGVCALVSSHDFIADDNDKEFKFLHLIMKSMRIAAQLGVYEALIMMERQQPNVDNDRVDAWEQNIASIKQAAGIVDDLDETEYKALYSILYYNAVGDIKENQKRPPIFTYSWQLMDTSRLLYRLVSLHEGADDVFTEYVAKQVEEEKEFTAQGFNAEVLTKTILDEIMLTSEICLQFIEHANTSWGDSFLRSIGLSGVVADDMGTIIQDFTGMGRDRKAKGIRDHARLANLMMETTFNYTKKFCICYVCSMSTYPRDFLDRMKSVVPKMINQFIHDQEPDKKIMQAYFFFLSKLTREFAGDAYSSDGLDPATAHYNLMRGMDENGDMEIHIMMYMTMNRVVAQHSRVHVDAAEVQIMEFMTKALKNLLEAKLVNCDADEIQNKKSTLDAINKYGIDFMVRRG